MRFFKVNLSKYVEDNVVDKVEYSRIYHYFLPEEGTITNCNRKFLKFSENN